MAPNHPSYLWYNGAITPWDDATVHVSEMGWSTIGAVFEGIRGYWNARSAGAATSIACASIWSACKRSMKLVHLDLSYSIDELIEATVELGRVNDCHHDTYFFPLAYTADTYFTRYDSMDVKTTLQIITRPMPSHLGGDKGMHAKVSSWRRISEDVMPPRVKNISNYRNGQLARQEVDPGRVRHRDHSQFARQGFGGARRMRDVHARWEADHPGSQLGHSGEHHP